MQFTDSLSLETPKLTFNVRIRLSYLLLFSLVIAGCTRKNNQTLHIIYTGNLYGYLEPCGCPEGKVGGLARMANAIEDSLEAWGNSALLVDAGDFTDPDAPADSLRHQLMLKAFELMNYQAINVTSRVLKAGFANLRWAADSLHLPLISANLIDCETGRHPFPGWMIQPIGDLQVGIIGLGATASAHAAIKGNSDFIFAEPIPALEAALAQISSNCDLVIVLCDFTVRASRALGTEVPGIDLIISTKDLPPTAAPKQFGSAFVVGPSHKGKQLTTLTVAHSTSKQWTCSYSSRLLDAKTVDDPKIQNLILQYRRHRILQLVPPAMTK